MATDWRRSPFQHATLDAGVRVLRVLAGCAAVSIATLALPAPTAWAGSLSWSDAIPLNTSGGVGLNSVACPSSTQCIAVDELGREVTFDPATGRASLRTKVVSSASMVTCPSVRLCVAVTGDAVATFDPSTPGTATVTTLISAGTLGRLSCPSTRQCTVLYANSAVSTTGEVTFDPAAPGPPRRATFPGEAGFFAGLACPAVTRCVAITAAGGELTFDPTAPGAPAAVPVVSEAILRAISCASVSRCTAVGTGGTEVTFDPGHPGSPVVTSIDHDYADTLLAVACPSPTQCSAIDEAGFEVTFDPTAPANVRSMQILVTTTEASEPVAFACSTTRQCTSVNGLGQELTFDPAAPATPSPATIDTGQPLLSVACASATQCTAVGVGGGEVTINPAAPSATPMRDVGAGATLDHVACPSADQCTATSGGAVMTFDPAAPSAMPLTTVDDGLRALGCPSVGQCTTVDTFGREVTFDPSAPSAATRAVLDAGAEMLSVACPTTRECAASDSPSAMGITDGRRSYGEMTFDPVTVGTTSTPVTAGLYYLAAIACPSAQRCIGVSDSGKAFVFDPAHPAAATATTIDPGHGLVAVACATTEWCVAIDTSGRAVAGDPIQPDSWEIRPLAGAVAPTGIACGGEHCVVVDRAGDAIIGTFGPWETARPVIRGAAIVGHALIASTGQWSGVTPMRFAEQWQRCTRSCVDIQHATGVRYVLRAADLGARVRVIITASDITGTAQATSASVGPIAPSTAQLKASLARALVPHGKAAEISVLLATRRYVLSFRAPTAGTITIGWYYLPPGAHLANARPKPSLIATGRARVATARTLRITLRLTAGGRRMLKRTKRLSLTAQGTFIATGRHPVSTTERFTLRQTRAPTALP